MDLGRNWPEILDRLEKSGLSAAEFSRQINIPYSTLIIHQRKARKKAAMIPEFGIQGMGFVRGPGEPILCRSESGIRIQIGSMTISVDKGFCPDTLASVLEVLHARS